MFYIFLYFKQIENLWTLIKADIIKLIDYCKLIDIANYIKNIIELQLQIIADLHL